MDLSRARCAGCGAAMQISKLECGDCGVALEGGFEVSALAHLPEDDQTFVHAFLRHHGSIKKMEEVFGVSYPTVKNRLKSITRQLDEHYDASGSRSAILTRLAKGEIDVDAALVELGTSAPTRKPEIRRPHSKATRRRR